MQIDGDGDIPTDGDTPGHTGTHTDIHGDIQRHTGTQREARRYTEKHFISLFLIILKLTFALL